MPEAWGTVLTFVVAAGAVYVGARLCWRVLTFPFRQPGIPKWLAVLISALNVGAGLIVGLYLTVFLASLAALPLLLRGPGEPELLSTAESVPVAAFVFSVFLTLSIGLTGGLQKLLTRALGRLLRLQHKREGAADGNPTGGQPPRRS